MVKWFIVKRSATSILAKVSALKAYGKVKTKKGADGEEELYYLTASDAEALVKDVREILLALDEN